MNPAGIASLIKIVEAGIEVFAQEGFFGAGTLEIAEKAGVAESTVFRKFDTKEDLFRECLQTALSRSLDPAQFQALLFKKDGEAGFSTVVLAAMKRWYSRLSVPAARLILFTSLSTSHAWRTLGSERTDKIIEILAQRITQDAGNMAYKVDPQAAATSLIATLLYLKSMRANVREKDPQMVDTVVHQWLNGIVQKQAGNP